jgi:UDP-N-acetylglucosamine 3-dehydrogenase
MIKIGVLGMGRMGNAHVPHLNANPNAKVVAAYDPDPQKAADAKAKFNLELANSAEELIKRTDIDAIFITSPTYCHIEALKPAFETGKPVFCEKPLCRTEKQCQEIEKMAQESKSVVTIGFVRRYDAAQKAYHEAIVSGKIGTVRDANVDLSLGVFKRMPGDWFADFDLSGGVVLDMLSHHLDLLIWDFGPVRSVVANATFESKYFPLPNDFAAAAVTFKSGVVAGINSSWHRSGRNANFMEAFGDDGSVSFSWGEQKYNFYLPGQPAQIIETGPKQDAYLLQDNAWIDSILKGTKPVVTLQDGINAFRFADAILRAAAEQTRIEL